jgi:hypothetical protein
MQVKINIPEYLSISDWKYFNSLEHLSDTEKMVNLICHLGGKDIEEVQTWKPIALTQVYKTLLEALEGLEPQFYPVFELDGVRYGYTPISKMTLGEYTDLERLSKDSVANLEQIMAILYRPIVKDNFGGIKWAFKNTFKVAVGEAENLFKYYETKEYDSGERDTQAKVLANVPASIGLGALTFFTVLGTLYSVSTDLSSLPTKTQMRRKATIQREMDSMSIGAGLLQFITSLELPSYTSQGRKLSQTSISSSYLTTWPMNKIKLNAKIKLENYKNELTE